MIKPLFALRGVAAGAVRREIHLGATGANQVKAFTRCGKGLCQGRVRGPIVCGLIIATLVRPI
jgi:hypothetical protein